MLLIAATGWLSGCVSPRSPAPLYVSLPPPPSEEVRAQLDTINVVVGDSPAVAEFTQPMGKGRAAGHGGWVGFWTPPAALASSGDGRGVILGLFLSPVTGTAGAIYGAVAGMSKEEYDRVCATLQQAVHDAGVGARVKTAVTEAVRPHVELVVSDAPTRLEVTPTLIRLAGSVDIEPPLTLVCTARVRLVQTVDGSELYDGAFAYTGSTRTLREWAAQDGVALRKELGDVGPVLAGQIIERVFLLYPLPDSPAQQRVLSWPPPKLH